MVDHRMTGSTDWNTVFIEMFLLIVLFISLSTRITINYRYNTVGVEILVNGCTVSCGIVTEVFGTDVRIQIKELSRCGNAGKSVMP